MLNKKGQFMKGHKLSEETKRKMSIKRKQNPVKYWLGKKMSEETRKKLSNQRVGNKYSLGHKHSKETRLKMSKNHKGIFSGNKNPMYGKCKEKNPAWLGGKSFEKYGFNWTDDLKESIRKRDNYVCQECGIHQDELKKKLDVHHIDYNKLNLNPNNLISLCHLCHLKTNFNRDYWIKYFNN